MPFLDIMDIQMPIMNGEEAIKAIRTAEAKASRYQPVIALTAHSLRGDKERFHEMGFDGYLSKPLESRELDKRNEARNQHDDVPKYGGRGVSWRINASEYSPLMMNVIAGGYVATSR